jgi:non-ribosomal peptide synthetase component F
MEVATQAGARIALASPKNSRTCDRLAQTIVKISDHLDQKLKSRTTENKQLELQNIAKLGPDAKTACKFRTLLVIQPRVVFQDRDMEAPDPVISMEEDVNADSSSLAEYFSYPLVWQCLISGDSAVLHITFDMSALSEDHVSIMAEQYWHIVRQLWAVEESSRVPVGDISLFGPHDMQLAQSFSAPPELEVVSRTFHDCLTQQARDRPDALAIYAYDGQLSCSQLDTASSRPAKWLVHQHKVTLEERIVVCFEKSLWFYVSIIAVNKAGRAWVPLDPSHPIARHEEVVRQARARIALTSPDLAIKRRGLLATVIEVSFISDRYLRLRTENIPLVDNGVEPRNAAYVLFTSGTTGKPKGLVMEHGSLCTSQIAIGRRLGMDSRVRLLQFAAYIFDLCIGEMVGPPTCRWLSMCSFRGSTHQRAYRLYSPSCCQLGLSHPFLCGIN